MYNLDYGLDQLLLYLNAINAKPDQFMKYKTLVSVKWDNPGILFYYKYYKI